MDLRQGIGLALAVVGMFVLLLIAVFGERGAADLMQLRQKKALLLEKNARLEQENIDLYRTIDRLENDLGFIENVARQELGMVRRDEIILKVRRPRAGGDPKENETAGGKD